MNSTIIERDGELYEAWPCPWPGCYGRDTSRTALSIHLRRHKVLIKLMSAAYKSEKSWHLRNRPGEVPAVERREKCRDCDAYATAKGRCVVCHEREKARKRKLVADWRARHRQASIGLGRGVRRFA